MASNPAARVVATEEDLLWQLRIMSRVFGKPAAARRQAGCTNLETSDRGRALRAEKNLHPPGKPENEGIQRSPAAHTAGSGLILLFVGEADPPSRDGPDEGSQADILTPGINLAPAFPVIADQWPLGVCSPLQWRNRSRLSRDSRAPGCHEPPAENGKPGYVKEQNRDTGKRR